MTIDRDPDAMPSPSGYLIDLYCCRVNCYSHDEAVGEGPRAYGMARRAARKQGWILHKDGFATCPDCVKKMKTQTSKTLE